MWILANFNPDGVEGLIQHSLFQMAIFHEKNVTGCLKFVIALYNSYQLMLIRYLHLQSIPMWINQRAVDM